MLDLQALGLFISAALRLPLLPWPGIRYIGARTLSGGIQESIASSLETSVGGFGQVVAAEAGFSAILLASAEASRS